MGDYSSSNSSEKTVIVERHITKEISEENIKLDQLIEAVSSLIDKKLTSINLGQINEINSGGNNLSKDDFDMSSTFSKMADSMLVSRGKKESNFENLGGVSEVKKKKDNSSSTIDLLKDLD